LAVKPEAFFRCLFQVGQIVAREADDLTLH
jgi:hypothetical protein